jgi:AraC family transcriptional regulator
MLASRIWVELNTLDNVRGLAIEGLALELVAEAVRCKGKRDKRQMPSWLSQSEQVLRTCLREAPLVKELAHAAGVHPVHFARTFRKYFRVSVAEYVRAARLEHAAQAISSSRAPFATIAAEAGFYDQSHLIRVFRKSFGVTPAQFRRSHARRA